MNKIKILVSEQLCCDDFSKNAKVDFIPYGKKTRIKDLYKKIYKLDSFKEFHDYDFFISEAYETKLRACYGFENGKIDWNIDMDTLYVYKIKEYFNNDFIVFWAHGGIGGPSVESFFKIFCESGISFYINKIFEVIWFAILFILSKIFINYSNACKILEKNTGKKIDYILKVINSKYEWKKGFISNKSFKHILKVEKRIMKKNGYKLKNNRWVR